MSKMQSAPPAEAPKAQAEYFHLPSFPAPGQNVILTVVGYNYIPEYQNPFDDSKPPYPAVEFFLGADTEGGVGFVKAFPLRYSLSDKATYTSLYRLATGKAPVPGSKPDDMVGAGLSATVENQAKTSKKGVAYTVSKVRDFAAVHPKLRSEITPLSKLKPLLDEALKSKDTGAKEDGPF